VWWLFSTLLFLAQGTQSFGGAETEIGEAALNQLLSMLPVQFDSLRLPIGTVCSSEVGTFVPAQSEPVERLKDFGLGTGNEPFPIGIFNANDELSAGLTSQ
jgi:hypothetical protein